MNIKFEDIKKANESIVTLDVKGKEYAQVNERIKAFRMVYPTGSIETEMLSNENGVCIFKAKVGYETNLVKIENDEVKEVKSEFHLLGTGTAYEKENSTFINKTSYIENCETSAVGRALGMAGFGIDTSICSAEEVQNAIANQGTSDSLAKMMQLVIETDTDIEELNKYFKVKSNKEMTESQLQEAIKILEKKAVKNG